MRALGSVLAGLGLVIGAAACYHRSTAAALADPAHGDRIVITADQIAKSGAQNVWEVIQRNAPQFVAQGRDGTGKVQLERRGQSSFLLDDGPMVIMDGTQLADYRQMTLIPANTVALIEILNAIDGTTYYGTSAEGGVILIYSKLGADE